MDTHACLSLLAQRGFVVEEERPGGSRHWLVFNPNSPCFSENDGAPDIFDDRSLVAWVQNVMLPAWEAEEQVSLVPDAP